MNLGVGAYRDEDGRPYVLNCVKKAEALMMKEDIDKEYAPITGVPEFLEQAGYLAYGAKSNVVTEKRLAITQSISGTGALRIGGTFLSRFYPHAKKIFIPTPTWGNHPAIFKDAGLEVAAYRYFDKKTIGLDITGMVEDLRNAPKHSIILLHACAHNPTGVDPTADQWKLISDVIKERDHFCFFDMAYQGFASGDCDADAYALRSFVAAGHRVALAQSFAKNMGMYGERIGSFSLVCESSIERKAVESQLKIVVRPMYSNPPIHGALVVAKVLGTEGLNKEWLSEVKKMADRIISMRTLLHHHLVNEYRSSHNWNHITDQIGMFCFTGLTPAQVARITEEHHVYLTKDGRISMSGITEKNVKYLAAAIHDVTK